MTPEINNFLVDGVGGCAEAEEAEGEEDEVPGQRGEGGPVLQHRGHAPLRRHRAAGRDDAAEEWSCRLQLVSVHWYLMQDMNMPSCRFLSLGGRLISTPGTEYGATHNIE